jgi:hypothetical protein
MRKRRLTETINFRLDPQLRKDLVAAQKKAGHSLAIEVTGRLRASLMQERAAKLDPHMQALLLAVQVFAEMIEKDTSARWHQDTDTIDRLCAGLPVLLRALSKAPVSVKDRPKAKESTRAGEQAAGQLMSAIHMRKALPPSRLRGFVYVGRAGAEPEKLEGLPPQQQVGRPLSDIWPITTDPLYDILYNLGQEDL